MENTKVNDTTKAKPVKAKSVKANHVKVNEIEAECPICCEKYNNSTRALVKCEYGSCENDMCKSCARLSLMSTPNDAHCFKCKNPFTDKFLVNNLGRTWVMTEYRTHRREMLYQREGIAKLADSMQPAIIRKKVKGEEELVRLYSREIDALRAKEKEFRQSIAAAYSRINMIRYDNTNTKKETAAVFIMNCTAEDCRGYLSSAYKCGLCDLYTCAKCFELVGHTRNDTTHVCKEENIQSADLIRKETKPCPSCGTRIHKIEGCDQMFCTCCKKAWSWNSGKIDETGRIHNPHYYQWQRELAEKQGTAMTREPGDIVCGGLIGYDEMRRDIFNKSNLITHEMRLRIGDIHRAVSHITNVDLEQTRLKVRTLGNYENLRIQYINNEITKEKMAVTIYRNDNSRKKYTEYLHVFELLSTVGIDMFRSLTINQKRGDEYYEEVLKKLEEYCKLREYCNELFANISRTYNQTVPQIDDKWQIKNKKFGISKRVKKVKENKEGEGDEEDDDISNIDDDDFETASQNGDTTKEKNKKLIIVV